MTEPPPTARQLQVLDLLSRGLTFQQVARHLGLSHHTIRSHMQALMRRLHTRNTTHAFRVALERGLLTFDGPPRVDHGVRGIDR